MSTGGSPKRRVVVAPRASGVLIAIALIQSAGHFAPVRGDLRPETELESNCFNFPANNFDQSNSIIGVHGVSPYLPMTQGDDAVDFTLHDIDGKRWNLREALSRGSPVVMIWGMFTCPAFQGIGGPPPFDKNAYWDENELVENYKDRATFVHMYGAEPHPTLPGTNFDDGTLRQNYWSVVPQQRSYQDRLHLVKRIRTQLHREQVILPDYLPGNPYGSDLIQPVWCTYARGARAVTVVAPNGTIFFQRAWLQTDHVAEAINAFWNGDGGDQGGDGIEDDDAIGIDPPPVSAVLKVGRQNPAK